MYTPKKVLTIIFNTGGSIYVLYRIVAYRSFLLKTRSYCSHVWIGTIFEAICRAYQHLYKNICPQILQVNKSSIIGTL